MLIIAGFTGWNEPPLERPTIFPTIINLNVRCCPIIPVKVFIRTAQDAARVSLSPAKFEIFLFQIVDVVTIIASCAIDVLNLGWCIKPSHITIHALRSEGEDTDCKRLGASERLCAAKGKGERLSEQGGKISSEGD